MPIGSKALIAALCALTAVAARAELDSAFYVWQFEWTDAVCEAVRESDAPGRSFMVLAEEWTVDGTDRIQRRHADVDWSLFAGKGPEQVLPVLRMNVSLVPWMANRRDALIEKIYEQESAIRGAAEQQGVALGPLQIDYDCPTARLADYRSLLQAYHRPVTITTLPTWLSSEGFGPLVRETSGYVLQLHSLEPPQSPSELGTIFSPTPSTFIEQASALGVPFHIALPTYGYAYYFDASGTFKRLGAEDTLSPWQSASGRRILMANPVPIAATVQAMQNSPPPHCRGFAWFRMPVEGDQLNWHKDTLAAVMNGNAPSLDIRTELKESDGRWECWLSNHGSADPWGQTARFEVTWPEGYPLALQGLGEYTAQRQGRRAYWSGPAPRVGSAPQLAGWMRFAGNVTSPSITAAHLTGKPMP